MLKFIMEKIVCRVYEFILILKCLYQPRKLISHVFVCYVLSGFIFPTDQSTMRIINLLVSKPSTRKELLSNWSIYLNALLSLFFWPLFCLSFLVYGF